MSIIPRIFLFLSFILLFLNGTALGFILYNLRFDTLFGYVFFVFTSLVGAVFASIAEESGTTKAFYCRYCLYGNLLIIVFPLYFHWVAHSIFPKLIDIIL
ncbi:hypothetical protein [Bacillus sp. REN16]|uniref:hypothetical protein n=1 Tax=Bacillus sp. REN16 TaxID=2887296 RepID=UPI001E3C9888|nr:hypothetical protein [Bacillus sp. REN16]MCC3358649.1 hypothetical protein [Bacillus sp. REN16]